MQDGLRYVDEACAALGLEGALSSEARLELGRYIQKKHAYYLGLARAGEACAVAERLECIGRDLRAIPRTMAHRFRLLRAHAHRLAAQSALATALDDIRPRLASAE